MAIGIIGMMETKASMEEYEREQIEAQQYAQTVDVDRLVEDSALDTDFSEGQQHVHDVERMDDALRMADETFRSMESLTQSLDYHARNSGLRPESVVYLNHAIEANYRSLGATFSSEHMISLEAFKGLESTRVISTEAASEGQKSKLRTYLEKAWAFIQEMLKKVIDGITNFFSAAERLKRRAQGMQKQIGVTATTQGGKLYNMKSVTVKQLKRMGQRLHIGGKSVTLRKAASVVHSQVNDMANKSFFKEILHLANKNYKFASKLSSSSKEFNDVQAIPGVIGGAIDKGLSIFGLGASTTAANIRKVWDKGEGRYSSSQDLPGGYNLLTYVGTVGVNDPTDVEGTRVSAAFKQLSPVKADFNMSKSDLPSRLDDLWQTLKLVIDICSKYSAAADNVKDVSNQLKDLCQKTNTQLKNINADSSNIVFRYSRSIFSSLRALVSSVSSPMGSLLSYCLSTAKFITDQCASLYALSRKEQKA